MQTLRILFAVACIMLLPAAAAHMLKTDGDIGVLMHVDPDDEPVAREPATFYFEIKDRSGKFSSARCDCRLRVLNEGREVLHEAPAERTAQANGAALAAAYTFAEAGVYRVELHGVPAGDASFTAFSVPFDVRVERNGAGAGSPRVWRALAVVLGAGLLALAAWAIIRVLRDMGSRSP